MTDEQAIAATMHKIQSWSNGEENETIDEWLKHDYKAYENIEWLMKECESLGWIDKNEPMFNYADIECEMVAHILWRSAMEFKKAGDVS